MKTQQCVRDRRWVLGFVSAGILLGSALYANAQPTNEDIQTHSDLGSSGDDGAFSTSGTPWNSSATAAVKRKDESDVGGRSYPHGNMDIRVNSSASMTNAMGVNAVARSRNSRIAHAENLANGIALLKESVRGADVTVSSITGAAEVVSAAGALTAAAPDRSGFDIVKDFIQANSALYGLANDDIATLQATLGRILSSEEAKPEFKFNRSSASLRNKRLALRI